MRREEERSWSASLLPSPLAACTGGRSGVREPGDRHPQVGGGGTYV